MAYDRYLDYLDSSPRTSSQIIRIGQNLLDLAKDFDTSSICTVLIPLGKELQTQTVAGIYDRVDIKSVNGGLDYIVSASAATYGYLWKTKTFDNISEPADLLAAAQTYLSNTQWANLCIEATAFDLGLTREDVQKFRVLDMIRVVSAPHNLDAYFMLTKLDLDLNDPANTKITLGKTAAQTISTQTAEVGTEIEISMEEVATTAAYNARQILEAATGGNVYFVYDQYGVCTEIRIMDTNDPQTATKIWRWNINGWGYSGDGGQTYSLAATMNGVISADFIKAGTIDAAQVNVTNLDADNINAGTITGIEFNNGSGTFAVSPAGVVTAKSGTIAGWTLNGSKIQSNSGNTYLSSDTSDFALKVSNGSYSTVIAHNGDIELTGHINLASNGEVQVRGIPAVKAFSNSAVRTGAGTNNYWRYYNDTTNGIYLVLNGTEYKLTVDGNNFLKVVPQ